jgi:hypothetical protein
MPKKKKTRSAKVTEVVVEVLHYLQDKHEGLDPKETVQFYKDVRRHLKNYIKIVRGGKRKNKKKAHADNHEVPAPPTDG